jgi:hypothetical protein
MAADTDKRKFASIFMIHKVSWARLKKKLVLEGAAPYVFLSNTKYF